MASMQIGRRMLAKDHFLHLLLLPLHRHTGRFLMKFLKDYDLDHAAFRTDTRIEDAKQGISRRKILGVAVLRDCRCKIKVDNGC